MAERGIFNQIKESLDEIMAGRRYLISAIDKLKKEIPDMMPAMKALGDNIQGLEAFKSAAPEITDSLQKVGKGFSAISQMSISLDDLRRTVTDLNNSVLQIRPVLDSLRSQQSSLQTSLDQLIAWITPTIQNLTQSVAQILARLH